jgi:hypothetical protein
MWPAQRTALGATHQMNGRERIVGAAAITPGFGQLTFWLRWHRQNSLTQIRLR